jgi:uncharacterized protein (DUF1697 family)
MDRKTGTSGEADVTNEKKKSSTFVAFLRGINVGGKNPIRMTTLREAFAAEGFENVRTVMAAGNVIFDTASGQRSSLLRQIQPLLWNTFGKEIFVSIRSIDELRALVDSALFRKVKVGPQTRLYVTFFPTRSTKKVPLSDTIEGRGFRFVFNSGTELGTHLELSRCETADLMAYLDREFGKGTTTRTFATIEKILKAATP